MQIHTQNDGLVRLINKSAKLPLLGKRHFLGNNFISHQDSSKNLGMAYTLLKTIFDGHTETLFFDKPGKSTAIFDVVLPIIETNVVFCTIADVLFRRQNEGYNIQSSNTFVKLKINYTTCRHVENSIYSNFRQRCEDAERHIKKAIRNIILLETYLKLDFINDHNNYWLLLARKHNLSNNKFFTEIYTALYQYALSIGKGVNEDVAMRQFVENLDDLLYLVEIGHESVLLRNSLLARNPEKDSYALIRPDMRIDVTKNIIGIAENAWRTQYVAHDWSGFL